MAKAAIPVAMAKTFSDLFIKGLGPITLQAPAAKPCSGFDVRVA